MAKGINKVILVGNVGKDPEIKAMQNGGTVANLAIATSESWKDKNTGQKQERTEWHNCVAFGKSAEIIAEYVRKGSKLYAEGSLRTRKWQDKEGNDRYSTEIMLSDFQMLDSRSEQQPAQQQNNFYQQPKQQNVSRNVPQNTQVFDDFEQDFELPF